LAWIVSVPIIAIGRAVVEIRTAVWSPPSGLVGASSLSES
jgi:hypothetical protein